MTHDNVDVDIRHLLKAVTPTLEEIQKSFRADNGIMVLQYYDMLLALPALHGLAEAIQQVRPELRFIERQEKTINVLDPKFLSQRLKAGKHQVIGDFKAFQLPQLLDPDLPLAERANASHRAYTLYEIEHDLEYVWALSLITVLQKAPEEEEHHQEIVEDFEALFERSSELLRAIKIKSSCPMDTMTKYHLHEGQVTPDVLMAALLKYQPDDSSTLNRLIEYGKTAGLPITLRVAGVLERNYVKCMKKEDCEQVFERYIGVGLFPVSTRMFAFLFNSKTLKKKTILDYYDSMLDYGIPPEPSLLRILCKQCTYMMFPGMHFTQCLKKFTKSGSSSSTPVIKGAFSRDPADGADLAGGAAEHGIQDSLRKNDRTYFAMRIRELAKEVDLRNETVPLLEAMKVVHRAEVEGTSLEGDNLILAALLTFFCNGTTPTKDLVYPFSESLAYHPAPVTLPEDKYSTNLGVAEAENVSEPSLSQRSIREVNAFDFGLRNDEGELLEEDLGNSENSSITCSTVKNSEVPVQPSAEKFSESKERKAGRRGPGIATPEEETEYVLRVLIDRGARPDNEVLKSICWRQEGHMRRDVGVALLAAEAAFNAGQSSRGAVEAVSCQICLCIVSELARQRNRHRLGRMLRIFVEQSYTYPEVYHTNWDFETKCNNERNSSAIKPVLISAMRIGPLDWSLGLLVLLIVMCPNGLSESLKSRLHQVRSAENHRSPHAEVVDLLERCNWDRNRILGCDRLMLETHELADANGGSTEDEPSSKKRSTALHAQETSSYSNSHGQESHPTLFTYLQTVLRELNVSREATNFYRKMLQSQRQAAVSSKRSKRS